MDNPAVKSLLIGGNLRHLTVSPPSMRQRRRHRGKRGSQLEPRQNTAWALQQNRQMAVESTQREAGRSGCTAGLDGGNLYARAATTAASEWLHRACRCNTRKGSAVDSLRTHHPSRDAPKHCRHTTSHPSGSRASFAGDFQRNAVQCKAHHAKTHARAAPECAPGCCLRSRKAMW